ncbi:MAG: hypothetical protein ACI9RG_000567 [Sulfurimonas sp.]|jgi:hypothetical protein
MNKILSITLISAVSIVLYTGCGGNSPSAEDRDVRISEDALYVKTHDSKKIIHAIEKAGAETGWKITEFKSNEVIAEKTDGDKTISSTVKFHGGYVDFSDNSETSDLRDAIEDELSKKASSH